MTKRQSITVLSTFLIGACSKPPEVSKNSAPNPEGPAARSRPSQGQGSDGHQIRWTAAVRQRGINGLTDVPALMAQPVDLSPNSEGPTFHHDNGDTEIPISCDDYFRLLADEYYPFTTFDMTMTGFFVRQCDTLKLLQAAKPAVMTHVENFEFDAEALSQIPADLSVSNAWENDEKEYGAKVWAEIYPDDKIEVKDAESIEITASDFITHISILAWADFDQDGLEDVLLNMSVYANGGTLRMYYHQLVTRLSPDGPLLVVDLPSDENSDGHKSSEQDDFNPVASRGED